MYSKTKKKIINAYVISPYAENQ
uniref:Uncharacterized protein n=1 Tax=Rhizophora mucronata TaxID=61149 RepID=A0A2P2IJM4_RHIMU